MSTPTGVAASTNTVSVRAAELAILRIDNQIAGGHLRERRRNTGSSQESTRANSSREPTNAASGKAISSGFRVIVSRKAVAPPSVRARRRGEEKPDLPGQQRPPESARRPAVDAATATQAGQDGKS